MRNGITIEQAKKIVSLAADASEIKDTIALITNGLTHGNGITSINVGGGNRGFITAAASIKASQAMLVVLLEQLQIVNADLVEAGLLP